MKILESIRTILEALALALKTSARSYSESLPESILARRRRDEELLTIKIRKIIERRMCFGYLDIGACDHETCPELDEILKEIR